MTTGNTGVYIVFWTTCDKLMQLKLAVCEMLDEVQAESGTLAYGVHTIAGNPPGVSVYEIYRDEEARRLHAASGALAKLRAKLPNFLGAPPEVHELLPIPRSKNLPF
jgi:quinol monooxygenase YgiN